MARSPLAALGLIATFVAACSGAATATQTPAAPTSATATSAPVVTTAPPAATSAAPSAPASAAAGPITDACSAISTAEASTILAVTSTTSKTISSGGGLSVCEFSSGGRTLDVTLDKSANAVTTFNATKAAAGATSISGLGDQAVWFAQPAGNVVMVALVGQTRVGLSFGATTGKLIGDAATQAAALQALLTSVVGRL